MNFIVCLNVIVILTVCGVQGFKEEAIFADEDIYAQAIPPGQTGITAPGTKWCGPGNTASDYDDLGTQWEADTCCRAHDHCPEILEPKTQLHGLSNSGWFPILACNCEQAFINCLQRVNNVASNALGRVYFSGRSKCFGNGYPIVDCKEHNNGTFGSRCMKYNVDDSKMKQWQFYDMPFYSISTSMVGNFLLKHIFN